MSHLSEAILRNSNGITLTIQDASVVALLRDQVDFFVIDAAAHPFSVSAIQGIIHAAQDKPVLVRVENTMPSTLQNYLNLGVDGLVLTGINYAAEAEKSIASCLYPPEGNRPYRGAGVMEHVSLQALNDQLTLVVEIGSAQAIAQIDEICEVTGINGIIVNPRMLAIALESGLDATQPTVQARLRQIFTAAQSYELPFGLEGEGFDTHADFRLVARDTDVLQAGLSQYFAEQVVEEEQEDMGFGLSLVARRE